MTSPRPDLQESAPPTAGGSAIDQNGRNAILRSLSPDDFAALQPHMERVGTSLLEVLTDEDEPFTHVFFPETGVISVVNRLDGGGMIEVGTVGNEGVAGLSVVLDAGHMPSVTMMQIPGEVTRVPASVFKDFVEERPHVRRLLNRYVMAFLIQVAQTAACNRAHEITERCARWLLMAHDRVDQAEHFLLTHEVLSQMLAVRRASVTVAAGILQRAGFIRYSRGRVTVVDRAGLEGAACECYDLVRTHLNRLLGVQSPTT